MSERGRDWGPSPRELHLLWYLRLITRYGVGVGGLIWAMLTNHLEPVLLMILGAISTSTDALLFTRDLLRAITEEGRDVGRDTPQQDGSNGSAPDKRPS